MVREEKHCFAGKKTAFSARKAMLGGKRLMAFPKEAEVILFRE